MAPAFDIFDLEGEGGADAREGEGHGRDQHPVPEAGGLGLDLSRLVDVGQRNAIQKLADFGGGEDGGLAAPNLEGRSFDGGGGVGADVAACDHPVEEASECCEVELHRRTFMGLSERLDIGGDMQRPEGVKLDKAGLVGPSEEPFDGSEIGLSGVFVADRRDEEFQKPFCSRLTGGNDLIRNRDAFATNGGQGRGDGEIIDHDVA